MNLNPRSLGLRALSAASGVPSAAWAAFFLRVHFTAPRGKRAIACHVAFSTMTLSEQSMNSSKLSSKASSRILGKVLAELNANQLHPSRDWKNERSSDRETFPDFSDCVEPVDEELPEWATAVVDRSSEGFFKDSPTCAGWSMSKNGYLTG
eukprot:s3411_g2.t1